MVKLAGRQLGAFHCQYEDAFVRIADPSEVRSTATKDFVSIMERKEEATLATVQIALGKTDDRRAYAEHVHAPHMPDVQIYVDEEGRLKGLAFNPIASAIANQPLFGPAVFLLGKARWS